MIMHVLNITAIKDIYYIDRACESDLCETVKKYDNTERFIVACQYAPEIRHHALFIAN